MIICSLVLTACTAFLLAFSERHPRAKKLEDGLEVNLVFYEITDLHDMVDLSNLIAANRNTDSLDRCSVHTRNS